MTAGVGANETSNWVLNTNSDTPGDPRIQMLVHFLLFPVPRLKRFVMTPIRFQSTKRLDPSTCSTCKGTQLYYTVLG